MTIFSRCIHRGQILFCFVVQTWEQVSKFLNTIIIDICKERCIDIKTEKTLVGWTDYKSGCSHHYYYSYNQKKKKMKKGQ